MALRRKIINEVGQGTEYHRINAMEVDFKLNQIHIGIESYTNESYRLLDKNFENRTKINIKRYYELLNKERNEQEEDEFLKLNIQELEAFKSDPKSVKLQKYTLPITDDFRNDLYKRLMNEVSDFKDAEEV